MKLVKAIVMGFIAACMGSLLLALGIVTTPFAPFGFLPLWGVATWFFYGYEDKEDSLTSKRGQRKNKRKSEQSEFPTKARTRKRKA